MFYEGFYQDFSIMSNNEAKSINWSASRYCVRWGAAPIPGYAQYVVPAENIVVDADVTAPRWGHCPAGGITRRKGCLPHLREQHQNTIEFSWIRPCLKNKYCTHDKEV